MPADPMNASDGFAIAMICMILLAMSTVGVLLLCMFRNARRRDPDVDALLDEIEETERQEKSPAPHGEDPQAKVPWERDSDWWKE